MKRLSLGTLCVLTLAACGSTHRTAAQIIKLDCHFAPVGSLHTEAAHEGLACPSKTQEAGPQRSTGLVAMDDSTSAGYLPAGVGFYAGYIDGAYRSYPGTRARFPTATTVGITVFMHSDARAADSEPGNPNPVTMANWAKNEVQHTANKRPLEYTMGSWQGWLEQANAAVGLPRCTSSTQQGCYLEWIASWDGNPVLYGHEACHQFTDHGPQGQNYDRSVCDRAMVFAAKPVTVDPRFNSSFNLGYADGTGGAYTHGYNRYHRPKSVEAKPFNTGFRAGFQHAYASGSKA